VVYKRYIYKNGKKIGPYYYENKKVDGKVISTYLGTTLPKGKELGKPTKSRTKDFLKGKYRYFIIAGVLILLAITFVNFVILLKPTVIGEISITLDEPPEQGEYLSGIVRLTMNKGELVPVSAVYEIDNVGETNQFPLSSLFSEQQVQGDFYMRGFELSGSGMGYGVPGEKTTYPEVEFVMKITKIEVEEETNITANQTPLNQTPTNQTSNISNYSLITGKAITEEIIDVREVEGVITAETPFTYELTQDETAEIVSSSQPVNLEIKDNIATITTDYVETKQGFGEDYLGEENVEFSFDLKDLNLVANQGELTITLEYNGEELISTSKTITLRGEPPIEEPPELGPPAPLDKSWWDANYQYKRQLQITNNMAANLITGYSVSFTIDTTGTNFLDNGNDLRVVWENAGILIEIDRVNETNFDLSTTQIWFKLQQDIPSSSTDLNYYIYYGNPSAGLPPQNRKNVYLWFDDFNRPNNPDITGEADYSIKTNGGIWSIENNQLKNAGATGDPNKLFITALGSSVLDVDMLTKINVSTWVANSDAARMGLSQDMVASGAGYAALFHNDQNSLDLLNDLLSWGTLGTYSWTTNTWYNMRFRVINPSLRNGQVKVWPVGSSEPALWTVDGNFGTGAARTNGYVGFAGSRQADITYFDDIQIRYIISQEPTIIILGESQNIPPSTPTNIQCNGGNNCDILIDNSLELEALGSIDPDEDSLTYFLEAYLDGAGCVNSGSCGGCGTLGQCSSCSSAGCSWVSGGSVNIFFENFESGGFSTNWQQDTQNDWYQSTQRSYSSGSYSAEVDGSATNAWLRPINRFDLSSYQSASVSAQIYIESSLDSGEYVCMDYSCNGGTTWNRNTGSDGTSGGLCQDGNIDVENSWRKITLNVGSVCGALPTNFWIRFRGSMSAANEDADVDFINISATSSSTCSGTLNCLQYSNQGTCESCSQCSWQTAKQWIEIGNHPEGSSFIWDTSLLPDQTDVNLRARAIDLTGSNTYSNYFTKNPTSPYLEILHGAASSCQDLTLANTIYPLENDVSADATCFNILANNITLDCQGHIINYAKVSQGYAVNSSYNFTNVRNCNMLMENTGVDDASGIYYYNNLNGTIKNNSLDIKGHKTCRGIHLRDSLLNNVSNNNIITYSSEGYGIYLDNNADNNTLYNNTIAIYGDSHGITMEGYHDTDPNLQPTYNQIINCNISTYSSAAGYGIDYHQADNNNVYNTSIQIFGIAGTGITLGSSGNAILSGNIIRTYEAGENGITLGEEDNITIINQDIKTLRADSPAIYQAFYTHYNIVVIDSVLDAENSYDINFAGIGGERNFTNVTFNKDDVYIGSSDGKMHVKWYLDVYVNDTLGNPVGGANVIIRDKDSIIHFNGNTDISGNIQRQNLTEYFQNYTGMYSYNNYTIYGQFSTLSDTEIINFTWNRVDDNKVVLTLEESNQPPTIDEPSGSISDQDPTDGGTGITPVVFTVVVTDLDGTADIVDATLLAQVTSPDTLVTRTATCINPTNIDTDTRSYDCTIDMNYYDEPGAWELYVEIQDLSTATGITTISPYFTYTLLKSIKLNSPAGALNWPTLNQGASNVLSNNHPNEIENLGNYEGPILITAYDLLGEDSLTLFTADNFWAGTSIGSACTSTQLSSPNEPIIGSLLPRGLGAKEEIYYCIPNVPPIKSQAYSTALFGNPWVITI